MPDRRPTNARQLIDGKLVESSTGATFDNVNPATEEMLGEVYDASPADVGDAIGAARRAFDETGGPRTTSSGSAASNSSARPGAGQRGVPRRP